MIEMRPEIMATVKMILVRLPGAEVELILAQLGDALREFTRDSNAWALERELYTMAGQRDYTLPSPFPDAAPTWALSARYAVTGRALSKLHIPATHTQVGAPAGFTCPSPGVLRIWPIPDAEYQLALTVGFAATSHLAPVPPWFITLYRDALMDGTLHRIYVMPHTPFFSMRLAEFHGRRFRSGISSARISAAHGLSRGMQVVPFRPAPAAGLPR